ncbi:methionyl-tRNA formyltransferase [Patescibacteria group bacterium]|nr:methionyl-tRNA formyltransferase [Patescibacteria group bacterium]
MQNDKSKLKIVFLGTSEFGAIVLEGLIKGNYKPILVVTASDKPVGRKQLLTPSPVKVIAQKYDIPVLQPDRIVNCKLKTVGLKPDLAIVSAYGQIIPKDMLDIPKSGFINVHPSLLPKYRGPSPIQAAILNGDQETGVTIILVDEKMDHGPIIKSSKLKVQSSKFTYRELHNKLAELGAKLLLETIPKWTKGEIKPTPQDESKATYTKILKKEDGKIDWEKSAKELERQVRAFSPWPGSYAFWQMPKGPLTRIKILKVRVFIFPLSKTYSIGKTLIVPQNEIGVQCGKDFLVIEKLQMEGGKAMGSEEFVRGRPDFIGTILK